MAMVNGIMLVLCVLPCMLVLVASQSEGLGASGPTNDTAKIVHGYFWPDTDRAMGNVNFFGIPGILLMVTKLDAILADFITFRQKPMMCAREVDAIKCGGSNLLDLWTIGSEQNSPLRQFSQYMYVQGSAHMEHGPQVWDIYGHNLRHTCSLYENYKVCVRNEPGSSERCISSTDTQLQTLYEYICRPEVIQDLIATGQCMSELTTERIMSHLGEPCKTDYAGFGLKVLQVISGTGIFSSCLCSDMGIYHNCYIPGVLYYCGEAAGRVYEGLLDQLDGEWVRMTKVDNPGWEPVDCRKDYQDVVKYYRTSDGMQWTSNGTVRMEEHYRMASRAMGSCSASGLLARKDYCSTRSYADMDGTPPGMAYACEPYGMMTQFTNCYQPALEHCALSLIHNISDVLAKMCSAFRSARTSDYCMPPLTVANNFLRACNMALDQFVDYIGLLNYKTAHIFVGNNMFMANRIDVDRSCQGSVQYVEQGVRPSECAPASVNRISAGLDALAGLPKMMLELYTMSYQERCAIKLIEC